MRLETSTVACTKAKHQQLQLLHTPPGTSAFPIQLVTTWNNFAPQQSYTHTCNRVICPMGVLKSSCAILHEPPPFGIEPLCHLAARTSARLGIYCAAAASRSSTGAEAAAELRWNMWLSSTCASEAGDDLHTQEQRQCHGRSWKRRKIGLRVRVPSRTCVLLEHARLSVLFHKFWLRHLLEAEFSSDSYAQWSKLLMHHTHCKGWSYAVCIVTLTSSGLRPPSDPFRSF